MKDRHRDVALFRYSLIREAADPALSPAERGQVVRYLASRDHVGPHGERVRVSRATLDRWIRAWRAGGFDALVPSARTAEPKTPLAVLDLAVADAALAEPASAEPESSSAAAHDALVGGVDALTQREREVLEALALGLSNRVIGERLGVSVHTVKFHVNAILAKLQVESRAGAVAKALRRGLLRT